MSSPFVVPMPGNEAVAAAIATKLAAPLGALEMRSFPDGETYLRFAQQLQGRDLILVCTLDRPDAKFLPLVFAGDTARDLGADRVVLVAPYLCYMRQDKRFHAGEAVTSVSFARLLSAAFDGLVTVDPHLHRLPAPTCIAVHALLSAAAYRALKDVAGKVVSTNAVLHESNGIEISDLLASAAADLLAAGSENSD